jgi:hypothetical protein
MGWEEERFEQVLSLLPKGWETKAKELGALSRARKIKTPQDLLRLILIYLTEGKSFAGTSAIMQLMGESPLTKKAVHKRMVNSKEGKYTDISAQVKADDKYLPVRICAIRKDSESERKGLKRLKHVNQRKKTTSL